MKILVTGGDGFIGRHLCLFLSHQKMYYHLWQDDIFQIVNFNEQFDIVIHLAAASSPDRFLESQIKGSQTNVIGTQVVLNYCRRVGAGIVFLSTCGVYPRPRENIFLSEETEVSPANDYAMSKWLGEQLCITAWNESRIPFSILRLFNVYGSGQQETFIIPYILNNLISGLPVILKTPYAVRDFIYISDVVDAIVRAIDFVNSRGKGVFNVGSGKGVTIIDVARCAENILGKTNQVRVESGKEQDFDFVVADIVRSKKGLNWFPTIEFKDGMQKIVYEYSDCCQEK